MNTALSIIDDPNSNAAIDYRLSSGNERHPRNRGRVRERDRLHVSGTRLRLWRRTPQHD